MTTNSRAIAARATAAKWGGTTPEVRDLARDLLDVLSELDGARAGLTAARRVIAHWREAAEEQQSRYAAGQRVEVVEVVDALTAVADRLEAALEREF